MIVTTRAHIEILAKFFMKYHRVAALAFYPQCLRATFTRKYCIDFWSNKVRDPIHFIYQFFLYNHYC